MKQFKAKSTRLLGGLVVAILLSTGASVLANPETCCAQCGQCLIDCQGGCDICGPCCVSGSGCD